MTHNDTQSQSHSTPLERHCARIQRQTPLSESDELALATRWVKRRDKRAGELLVEAHLPMVLHIARRLRGYGVSRDELIAEGNVGLLRALEKFELRGVRFKTYATYWVRAHMLACAQRHNSIVTVATGALGAKLFFKLRSARAKAEALFGAGADSIDSYLAAQFGVTEEVIRQHLARLGSSDASLDAPMGEEGDSTRLDFLSGSDAGPEEAVSAKQREVIVQAVVREAWPKLDARERAVVTERLMADEGDLTLSQLGARFKLSRERLRQIEVKLKDRFRQLLGGHGFDGAAAMH